MLTRFKPKSEFSRNVLTLMTGTTIAQAIPIAISPVLTRIYTPEEYGVFSVFLSISVIASVIVTGRYELSILIPKSNKISINILFLTSLIVIFVSIISLIVIMMIHPLLYSVFDNRLILQYIYIIPFVMFSFGFYQTFNYWLNRNKEYGKISKSKIIQATLNGSLALTFGFIGFSSFGLIIASYLAQTFVFLYLYNYVKKDIIKYKKYINLKVMKFQARKHNDLPTYSTAEALLGGITGNLPVFLLGLHYSVEAAGFYAFAYRICAMPVTLFGKSLGQVFFQKFSYHYSHNKDYIYSLKVLIKLWIILSLIGLPFVFIIFNYSSDIFGFVFGSSWIEAGEYSKALSFMLFFLFIFTSTNSIHIVLKLQNYSFYMVIVSLVLKLGFFYLSKDNLNSIEIVFFLSLIDIILMLFMNAIAIKRIIK